MNDEKKTKQELVDEISKLRQRIARLEKDQIRHTLIEERLMECEKIYTQIIENLSEGIWIVDKDWCSVFVNSKMLEIVGYTKEEIIGKILFSFMDREMVQTCKRELKSIKGHGMKEEKECGFLRKDGERIWTYLRIVPLINAEGDHFGAIVCVLDITEHKQVLKKRMNSVRKYYELYENLRDGSAAVNMDRTITEFNSAFQRMLGYTREELYRLKCTDITPQKWHSHEEKILNEQVIKRGYSDIYEKEYKRKDGTIFPVELRTYLIRDGNEKPVGMWAIVRDVTERKRLEEQLFQAQKMDAIGILAGGVAHDFNNHLTIIIGYCDYLIMLLEEQDYVRKKIEEIKKAGERAASLTHQLLAFSRRQMLQPKVFDLNDLVTEMEKMLKRLIEENIVLVTNLEKKLKNIKADEAQIEQVIMNLAINAKEAMPEGGTLTIKTENVTIDKNKSKRILDSRPGEFVCLSVDDTGIGMEPETLSHIFDPFFTTKKKGSGLGLSVSYGIVKQHDGWINVNSESGAGSSFKVYLPASSLPPEKSDGEVYLLSEFQGRGERVLLVEDEKMVREFASETLKSYGYVVAEAESAEEAIDIFEKEKGRFDVVFSDVVLPDMTGIDLVDELLSRNQKMKVLMSSGYFDRKSKYPLIQEKGFVFLQKPYSIAELLKALREIIELS